jgi:hypothetical protein
MKNVSIFLVLILVLSTPSFSQTADLELEFVKKKYERGEISAQDYQSMGKKWQELMNDYGGYPDLDYDTAKETITYSHIVEIPALPKRVIFDRILEWSSISFGNLNTVLHYQNFENGKIIIKGSADIVSSYDEKRIWSNKVDVNLTVTTVDMTLIFTVKDNKYKLEIDNLKYGFRYNYLTPGTNYYTEKIDYYSISSLYPITAGDVPDWRRRLSILSETKKRFDRIKAGYNIYIKNYQNDYDF